MNIPGKYAICDISIQTFEQILCTKVIFYSAQRKRHKNGNSIQATRQKRHTFYMNTVVFMVRVRAFRINVEKVQFILLLHVTLYARWVFLYRKCATFAVWWSVASAVVLWLVVVEGDGGYVSESCSG